MFSHLISFVDHWSGSLAALLTPLRPVSILAQESEGLTCPS
jgi:hypothetical protein